MPEAVPKVRLGRGPATLAPSRCGDDAELHRGRLSPRVLCGLGVPSARHGAGHTGAFDETAAWLAVRTAKAAVTALLRTTWRTVGRIVTRVGSDAQAKVDHFAGLHGIGIDEMISYKRGDRYLTVVVDHDRNRLVWAAVGRDEATLRKFFDELGEEHCAALTLVSADAAPWIATVVRERSPKTTLCLDPFHVCQWAGKALDEVRREVWNAARRGGHTPLTPQSALCYF